MKAGAAAGAAALWVPAGTVCACRCLSDMCYLSPELVLSAYTMVPNISLRSFHRAVEVIFLIPLRWARVERPTGSKTGDWLRFKAEYVAAMAPWKQERNIKTEVTMGSHVHRTWNEHFPPGNFFTSKHIDFISLIMKITTLAKPSDLTKIEEANVGGWNNGWEDRDGFITSSPHFSQDCSIFFPLQSLFSEAAKHALFELLVCFGLRIRKESIKKIGNP